MIDLDKVTLTYKLQDLRALLIMGGLGKAEVVDNWLRTQIDLGKQENPMVKLHIPESQDKVHGENKP